MRQCSRDAYVAELGRGISTLARQQSSRLGNRRHGDIVYTITIRHHLHDERVDGRQCYRGAHFGQVLPGLTLAGAGTLIVNASNTFAGPLTINGGIFSNK